MSKSAVARIDWNSLSTKLRPETFSSLNAFRRRHAELTKQLTDLSEASTTIDFSFYKNTLKNSKVVAEAQKTFTSFKPATVSLSEKLDFIKSQEEKAVKSAKETTAKVESELKELKELLVHIETARPVDQLTVDDVAKAYPELDATVEKMIKRGQWNIPGYYEKFGQFKIGF